MEIQPTEIFETRLEVCYEVMLYLAARLQKLAAGEVLAFVSSDPNARHVIPSWADERGFEVIDIQELELDQTRFLIRRYHD